MLLIQALWLLAPGLLAGLELHRRELIGRHWVVPVAAVIGCGLGYGAFWMYFADHWSGKVYCAIVIVVAVAAGALIVLSPERRRLVRAVDVAAPLALLGLVALFYSSITFGCSVAQPVSSPNQLCHLSGLTGDNILPLIFANAIHHGDPHALIWGWQLSARPPLQTGAVLMQSPLVQRSGWQVTSYLSLSILMQVLWIPVLWALCRSLPLSGTRLAFVVTLCTFSGFFLFNSVFTWPKLLSASLALTAFGLLFFERRGVWTWTLGGLAAAEAMLAHTGVVFTLLPMVVALLTRRFRPSWRLFAVAGVVAVAVLVPWQLYQRLYDPPGDGLLKIHLAGGLRSPDDHRSLGQLLHDNYTQPSLATIAKNKLTNVTQLVGVPNDSPPLVGNGLAASLRDEEFRYTVFALGLFHLGWLVLLLRSTRRRLGEVLDLARLKLMLVIAGFATLVWLAIMYGPPQALTVIFANSYATVMLIFVALAAAMTVLPRWARWATMAVQVGYTAVIWVATVWQHHFLHRSYVVLSVLSGVALLALLATLHRWLPGDPPTATADDDGPLAIDDVPSTPVGVTRPVTLSSEGGA